MSIKRAVKEGREVALALLKFTSASADVFPPLKSVAGSALHIAELVTKFKSNQAAWSDFDKYVQDALASLIVSLPDASEPREDLKRNVETLRVTLHEICDDIQSLQDKSLPRRFWSYTKDPEKILDMRQKLQDALSLFQLGSMVTTGLDVAQLLKEVDIQRHLQRVMNKLSGEIGYKLTLAALPYAQGASWDKLRVCMNNTRVALLEDIWAWINATAGTGTAEIFWLADVAGAGKSAVAHTVAQRCWHAGLLASSFFFDREAEGRNGPRLLFSTIARDLANLDAVVAEHICLAIEDDWSLATAPISRQFDSLILEPSMRHSSRRPVVMVIDALDEGYNTDLLKVLRDEIPKLPGNFRIFLTSRSEDEINRFLSGTSHIRRCNINIHGEANQMDISSYVQLKLQGIAEQNHLEMGWPGDELSQEFMKKADGLFLWVSTVSEYLRLSTNPVNQLKLLLVENNRSNIPAEEKMDMLYRMILGNCNWKDLDFVEGYGLVMGTIISAKTPLSSSALQALHPTVHLCKILGQFGALINGWTDQNQPIRIIHLSFRDFLTHRAHSSPETTQFYVDELEHNQRLGLLCIQTLNEGFKQHIPGTGYLTSATSDMHMIPEIPEKWISEEFWYSCRFWIDHLVVVNVPDVALTSALQSFMSAHLVHWIEVVSSRGKFQKLSIVLKWLQDTLPREYDLKAAVVNADLAKSLSTLSGHLSGFGRREEALHAIEDAVNLYQQLAEQNPPIFNSHLGKSLTVYAKCLSALGQQEEALQAGEDAVRVCQQVSEEDPKAFNSDFAMSLNVLSTQLCILGQQEGALQAIKEAVGLHEHLAEEDPKAFNPDLATSLNNMSNQLYHLGQREDALQAIQSAVKLRRQLAEECPKEFNPHLARSLNNLSLCLSNLGEQEKALQAIEEAVKLHQQLAEENPMAFNPILATSLSNLSNRLSELGRQDEALQAIEAAVKLHQQLAEEQPIAFNPNLAMSLNNLSNQLFYLRDQERALQAIEAAVKLYQQLADGHPKAFNSHLAMSLNNLSNQLGHLGQQQEALQAIKASVKLYQQLAEEQPMAFKPKLAMSLNNLSNRLSALGQHEEALHTIKTAAKLHQQLSEEHPKAFTPHLAMSLNNLSLRLSNLGQHGEALQAIKGAVELRQQLAAEHPKAFIPDLARSLNNLSNCLSNLGQQEKALKAIKDAVNLYRSLAQEQPAVFNHHLRNSLYTLSHCLSQLNYQAQAVQATDEAAKLLSDKS